MLAVQVATASAVAPVISVSNGVLSWAPISGATGYQVAIVRHPATTRDTTYVNVSATSYTPAAVPGETVNYGVYPFVSGGAWATEVSIAWAAPGNTTPPTISGTAQPGSTLTASKGTWTGYPAPSYTYQWQLCATTCTNIAGATSASYATPLNYNNVGKKHDVVVTASSSSGSASRTSALTAAIPEPPAPVLHVTGKTIGWTAIPGITQYQLAETRDGTTTYTNITGTSYSPAPVSGEHVNYGLIALTPDSGAPWATEVTINWPIIGINGGSGWGTTVAGIFTGGHITWDRIDLSKSSPTVADATADGYHVLGIVGNTDQATLLSAATPATYGAWVVDQLEDNPGIDIAEAGNEMYLKGDVADPVHYGRMYLAAVNAMATAGIHTRLLFDMWGDYACGSTPIVTCPSNGWSQDSGGRGWLADAVDNVPGLAAAIEANGLSTHPYGAIGGNDADEYGTAAVAAQEAVAADVLGSIPPVYVTEEGFNLAACTYSDAGACSLADLDTKLQDAMAIFLADDHIEGVWWYDSLDYGPDDRWGVLNDDDTPRAAFTDLSAIAQAQGQ
jgi:hypothetical protein